METNEINQVYGFTLKELEDIMIEQAKSEGLYVEFSYESLEEPKKYIECGLTLKQVAYISDTTENTVLYHSEAKKFILCYVELREGSNIQRPVYHPDVLNIWKY